MHERPRLIGVSLKMYFDVDKTRRWSADVAALANRHAAIQGQQTELLIVPSLPVLSEVAQPLRDSGASVGAQDVFWEDRGAFTGAVSPVDLAQIGCRYVEIGHAERRSLFAETDEIVRRKVEAVVRHGLTPLLCIGEPTRGTADEAIAFCQSQLASALEGLDVNGSTIAIDIAYEPVWAIGQSDAADREHVMAVSTGIKQWLADRAALAGSRVIYGGSAAPGTLTALGRSVDGLFLGRFAHDPAALEQILDETLPSPH